MHVLFLFLILMATIQVSPDSRGREQGGPPPVYIDYSKKLDEYGHITSKDEATRLDDVAAELRSDPGAMAYLIAYGGRTACVGEAGRRARWAKSYLVRRGGLPPRRVVWKDGGFREEPAVEVWLTFKGHEPAATPTLERREVRLIRCSGAGRAKP
jgi:hypothetical protein